MSRYGTIGGTVLTSFLGQGILAVSGIGAARLLGVSDRGKLALFNLLPTLLGVVGTLGLPIAATYFIARDPDSEASVVRTVTRACVPIAAAATLADVAALAVLERGQARYVLVAAAISVPLAATNVFQLLGQAILQGQQRYKLFNWCRTLPTLVYAAGVAVLFVSQVQSLIALTLLFTASSSLAAAVTMMAARRHASVPRRESSEVPLRKLLGFGLRAVIGAVYPTEAFQLDQATVGLFLSSASLGLYVVAVSFTNLPRFIAQSFGVVAYPRIASSQDPSRSRQMVVRYTIAGGAMALIVCVALEVSVGFLIPFVYGHPFAPAVAVTRILLISSFIVSVRRVLADGLRGAGYPTLGTVGEASALAFMVPALAVFVASAGLKGAAVAVCLSAGIGLAVLAGGCVVVFRRERSGRTKATWSGARFTRLVDLASLRAPASGRLLIVAAIAVSALGAELTVHDSSAAVSALVWVFAGGVVVASYLVLRDRSVVGLVLIYGFVAFGAAAAAFYHPTAADYGGSAPQIAYFAAATPGRRYLILFAGAGLLLCLAFRLSSPPRGAGGRGGVSALGLTIERVSPVPGGAIILAVLPLLLDAYGVGFHTVLHSPTYLAHSGPIAASKVGRALGPVGLLLAGNLLFSKRSAAIRVAAAGVAVGYAALYLGTATRSLGLVVPLIFLGGLLGGRWNARQRRGGLVAVVALALVMVQLPLSLRSLPNQGLVPAVTYIRNDPRLLFQDPIGNLLFGAPLTLYVAHNVPRLPLHDLSTSVSPLPSSLTDWNTVRESLRVNAFLPYPALGELLSYGLGWFVAGLLACGVLFAWLERLVRRSRVPGLGLLVLSAVAVLLVLQSTEYNLRSAVRLCYYVAFVVVGLVLGSSLLRGAPRRVRRRRHTGSMDRSV